MKKILPFITVLVLTSLNSKAQNSMPSGPCDQCNAIIVQDRIISSSSLYQQIKFYESINEETYHQLQKEASAGFSLLKLISAKGDYKEFQESLTKYKKEKSYDATINSSNEYSSYTTNPIVYTAWSECMARTCSNLPFNAWVVKEEENQVSIKMKYTVIGDMDKELNVRIEIKQNNVKQKTEYIPITPGADLPYTISRILDKFGKSDMSVIIQPINKRKLPIYGGLNFTSNYFKPLIIVNNITVEYFSQIKDIVYNNSPLNAPDFGEKHNPFGKSIAIGIHSCGNGKYFAYPLVADLIPKKDFYFEQPNDLEQINFVASGPGAPHNQPELQGACKAQCAQIRQSSPILIKVLFAGSSGLATNWAVSREETKDTTLSIPLIYYYVDKNNINFSLPLGYLKNEYKIKITTPNMGTFIIDKNSSNSIPYTDSNNIRYYKLNLQKLLEPEMIMKLGNIEMYSKPEFQKKLSNDKK